MSSAPASIRTTEAARPAPGRASAGRWRRAPRLRTRGIGLVELMVGMTIGLIALLVMVQTFSASNAHKANTVSGADATTAGQVAMTLLERDLLNAGAGLIGTGCRTIKYLKPGTSGAQEMNGMPVTIVADPSAPSALASRSDRITIRYASSGEASIAKATLTESMPSPSSTMFANIGMGFSEDDLIVLNDAEGHCAIQQLTQDPGSVGRGGGAWRFQINPSSPYNDPGDSAGLFPSDGYQSGTGTIRSLGPGGIAETVYRLQSRGSSTAPPDTDLATSRADMASTTAAQTLVRDVVALRAQYGWWNRTTNTVSFSSTIPTGAGAADLVAVRVGILVRASQRDASYTAPETFSFFEYDTPVQITLGSAERNYRYRSYETVVPLRNALWNRE